MSQSNAKLHSTLQNEGIIRFSDIYSSIELQKIIKASDAILAARVNEPRAYVHINELVDIGVWPIIFSDNMKAVLFSIMPDPVLYHCHIYEIAGNSAKPHIFSESLDGWHRDPDSKYYPDKPTNISIFVYLTDVGYGDGAFEFVLSSAPSRWLRNAMPYLSIYGNTGLSFAWNRCFFHRASANRSPIRRRVLKISIHSRELPNINLKSPNFLKAIAAIPYGDPSTDMLLGRYGTGVYPKMPELETLPFTTLNPTGKIAIANTRLFFVQMKNKILYAVSCVKYLISKASKVAGYD